MRGRERVFVSVTCLSRKVYISCARYTRKIEEAESPRDTERERNRAEPRRDEKGKKWRLMLACSSMVVVVRQLSTCMTAEAVTAGEQ